jgi:hypothetical protein
MDLRGGGKPLAFRAIWIIPRWTFRATKEPNCRGSRSSRLEPTNTYTYARTHADIYTHTHTPTHTHTHVNPGATSRIYAYWYATSLRRKS